ncbi:MAG: hypothetical protein GXO64_03300, partial [Candidatus Micrarchaeota archaeon]|nr:hypothetical protein [Candidatus Micrarchaeota archaeon]
DQNGTFTIKCNITDNATAMYNASSDNYEEQSLLVAVIGQDTTAPQAVTYNINDTSLYKGEDVLVYAQWDDLPDTSLVEYNSTNSTLYTYTVSTPYTNNWTNYTIDTDANWVTGKHYVKLYANDSLGNMNDTLEYLVFDLWGNSRVSYVGPTGNIDRGTLIITCRVTDDDSGSGIGNYSVEFYDENLDYLGNNDTNSSGYAQLEYDFSEYAVGPQTLYCRINNELSLYYYVVTGGDQDTGTPVFYGYLNTSIALPQNNSNFMKGETISLNSTTKDENDTAISPATVLWYNTTQQIASGINATWTIPTDHSVGSETVLVNSSEQYYYNSTNTTNIYIWGYSEVSWNFPPSETQYQKGTNVTLRCDVKDSNMTAGIENYTVSFYVENSTNSYYIGDATSTAAGQATRYWDTSNYDVGIYYPKCNITDQADIFYNATLSNNANTTVNITPFAGNAWLAVELSTPPTITGDGNATVNVGYVVGKDRYFVVNATAVCHDDNCGSVDATLRYNKSSESPDTTVPDSYSVSDPFFTDDGANPRSCSSNLLLGENCTVSFRVNSTGNLNSLWKIDVYFSSSTATPNATENASIEIGRVFVIDLTFSAVDFGSVDPGTNGSDAPGNSGDLYKIVVDNNSNDISGGIWKKGTDLTNSTVGRTIGVSNITMCTFNNYATCNAANRLNTTYSLLQNQNYVSFGTNVTTYLWIDVPNGIDAATYTGNIYLKFNTTD